MTAYRRNILFSEHAQFTFYQFIDHFLGRERGFKLFKNRRRKLYSKLHQRLKAEGVLGQLHEIDTVEQISIEDFKKNYIEKERPLIIKGGAKDWGAVKEWSLDYFKERYGEEDILFIDFENQHTYERLKLKDIIDGIRDRIGKYYRFYPLLQRHPEHIEDFDHQWLRTFRHKINWSENFNVFIGGEGSKTPPHHSFSNNIFIQVYGEKEWVIYPTYYSIVFDPDPAKNMYRGITERNGKHFDPFNPDFEKHPLFKYIDGYRVVLEPGDILYNPAYWWHTILNHSDSIGVGYRWLPPIHCYKKHPFYFTLDMLTTKPPLWKSLQLAKKDLNLVQMYATGKIKEYKKLLKNESA